MGTSPSLLTEDSIQKKEPEVWVRIDKEYGLTKKGLEARFLFIEEDFKRSIIFRDIEHAFLLSELGYYKPSVLLSGGVIEELLRLYLSHKTGLNKRGKFMDYINELDKNNYLSKPISNLTDSVRLFRNNVHLIKEKDQKVSITKAHSKSALSSLFSLIDSFI